MSASDPATRANGVGGTTIALLGFSVIVWATGWWPLDIALTHTSPIMLATLRIAPTLILVLCVFALLRRRLPRGQVLGASVASGFLMFGFFQWVLMDTVATIGPGNSAVIINTSPLAVALLGFIFLGERLKLLASFGLLTGFVGVVMMVWSQLGDFPSAGTLIGGVAIGFAGASAWGAGALVLRAATRDRGDIDMIGVTVVQYAAGSALLVPLGFGLAGTSGTDWAAPGLWLPLVWVGPVTGAALLVFFVVLQRVQAARASAVLFLVPGVAILIEIARGNAPGAIALAGMFVAVLGVALATASPDVLGRLSSRGGARRARV